MSRDLPSLQVLLPTLALLQARPSDRTTCGLTPRRSAT